MNRRWIFLLAGSLFVANAVGGQAQQTKRGGDAGSSKAAAPEKTGIAIGEKAPPIKLKDQAGKDRSLEEFLHDGTVAVVFYRSASW